MQDNTAQQTSFDLGGHIALVTGAAGWLGRPMAEALAQAGAHVYLAGRSPAPLKELEEAITQAGGTARALPISVTDAAACLQALDVIRRAHGRLNLLVNNAYSCTNPAAGDAMDDSFAEAADISLGATWRLVQGGLPMFRAAVADGEQASIINIGSMYGKVSPVPAVYDDLGLGINPPFYGAAKAGLAQLTRWMAARLGPEKIRVNTISPGPFPQYDLPEKQPAFVARLAERTMLGRTGHRHEVAGAVCFLASPAASYITGADIPVDGGWTAW